jgi:hypothetical protein
MSDVTNTSGVVQSEPKSNSIGIGVDKILDILKEYPKSEAQTILKMVGAAHNVRFASAFAPLAPQSPLAVRDTRGQQKPRVQPLADPKVKALRSKIKELNTAIRDKSQRLGGILPETDTLIVKRGQLFRELKASQNKTPQSFSEATEAETLGSFSGDPAMPGRLRTQA